MDDSFINRPEPCFLCFEKSEKSFDFQCVECGVRFLTVYRNDQAYVAYTISAWSPSYKRHLAERLEGL